MYEILSVNIMNIMIIQFIFNLEYFAGFQTELIVVDKYNMASFINLRISAIDYRSSLIGSV